jgi:phosphoribosylformylglycinamidine synthase
VAEPVITVDGYGIRLSEAEKAWESTLESIFPTSSTSSASNPALSNESASEIPSFSPVFASEPAASSVKVAKPHVLLTVFPGTNCEYDTAIAFEKAGAETQIQVFKNLTPAAIDESIKALAGAISKTNIMVIPGGFSAGDEPDGAGKFIAAVFREHRLRDAIHDLLYKRDGLILGICNGFQALIKLGLLPYGKIREQRESDPTLTFNSLNYKSRMATTRIASNASPWLLNVKPGDQHVVAIAHGEGRVVGQYDTLIELLTKGQVATQYVDDTGQPSMSLEYNPNGSTLAIEGLLSPDGRVFGKMGHAERYSPLVWQNVPGNKDMGIFRSGVEYFQ